MVRLANIYCKLFESREAHAIPPWIRSMAGMAFVAFIDHLPWAFPNGEHQRRSCELTYEEEYEKFVHYHLKQRKGERLRRLKEGHGYAEKLFAERVCWPAFGQFRELHPEYEVFDFKDGHRYLDYAFIRPHLRLAIEIDGYGPHWRNQSRWQFSDQWQRQNHLIIDGWLVLRFTYDDICDKPRLCQQILQQFMGAMLGEDNSVEQPFWKKKLFGTLSASVDQSHLMMFAIISTSKTNMHVGYC
jgi:very-short-patch-repair endonuclease